MPGTEDLRVALAGYGLAGGVLHAPLVEATDGLRVAAVVTRDAARAARARVAHAGVVVADALEDVLDHADVVVVASPNRLHVAQAEAALGAGCHVVVDKPVAVDGAGARRLAERAAAAGRLLVPFHNRRWDDDVLTLRRVMGEGRLGDVLRLESRFDRWRPEVAADAWREEADPAAGGGLLLDLGTHLVDQACLLLGEVTHVYAELDRRRPGAAVEDDVFIALTHASGARSHLWAGVHAAHAAPRLRVVGGAGGFVSEGLDPQEAALRGGARPTDPGFGRRGAEAAARLYDGERGTPLAMEAGDWAAFYRGVVAAIRDGAPPPVTVADAVRVAELLDAARASAASASVVPV